VSALWEQLQHYAFLISPTYCCNQFVLKDVFLLHTFNVVYPWVPADSQKPIIGDIGNHQRLGPAGLALHYANIVLQIDTLVSQSMLLYLFHSMTIRFAPYPESGGNLIEFLEMLLLFKYWISSVLLVYTVIFLLLLSVSDFVLFD
jgi:hypothetical protein